MSRHMSCSMTIDAVRNRAKTVTRRDPITWSTLQSGDHLTLVEKVMGLEKGSKHVILAEVEVLDNRVESITNVTADEITLEGFDPAAWTPIEWARWWAQSHWTMKALGGASWAHLAKVECRRIEWRYLDEVDR